jgi:polysaccharide pyruvyl transferase WcaK-like protein
LKREDVDCVGTRLHAGIRALQRKRRAIILGVDNRAEEMGHDFDLPVVARGKVALELEAEINGYWETRICIARQAIAACKGQFKAVGRWER